MASTFRSPDIFKARRVRPVHDGLLGAMNFTYTLPSGTLLGVGDVIRLGRVDAAKIIPVRAIIDVSTRLDGHATAGSRTLEARLGYLKSADRAGTNISFTAAAGSTTAATEDDDILLAKGTVPLINSPITDFADTAATSLLTLGGVAIFNTLVAGLDSRGYDANVMDVAITVDTASSTATLADSVISLTLEFLSVSNTPGTVAPYIYKDRYSAGSTGSF